MEIESIVIENLYAAGTECDMEQITHHKVLPCLSIAQADSGSYDIGLNDSPMQNTGEGGAFVAPAGVRQCITHHNGAGGQMRAHWVYMDVMINRFYRLEELFDCPMLLPKTEGANISEWIETIRGGAELCERYAAAYRLVGLLMRCAVPAREPEPNRVQLQQYVAAHFRERVTAAELAGVIPCSLPQLFRYSQKFFGMSPANYVNAIRLQNAARLLESTDMQIKEAAFSSGFDDVAYFSRLFRKAFGTSPSQYRASLRGRNSQSGRE